MKLNKVIIATAAIAMLIPGATLAVSSNASAQSNGQSTATSTGTTQSISNRGVSGAIRNCEQVEAKIQTRLQNYATVKEAHTEAYQNLFDRLDTFVTNIKAKGYDTTTLEADIAVLQQKIEDFNTLIGNSYGELQQTQTYTCGQAEGQFIKSLAKSRQQVRLSHQKAQEIRTFYRDVIRVDLLELKTQNPGAVSSSTSSTTESAGSDETTSTGEEE